MVKNLPGNAGDTGSILGLGRSTGKENGNPTPVFFPGKFHGQRSLVSYSLCSARACAHMHTHTHTHTKKTTHWYSLLCVDPSGHHCCFFFQQVAEIACRDSLNSSLVPPLIVASITLCSLTFQFPSLVVGYSLPHSLLTHTIMQTFFFEEVPDILPMRKI